MSIAALLSEIDEHGRATITLNRPEMHNAFDDTLISALTEELKRLDRDQGVRVILLAARGKSFSSGADLNWMRRMADYSFVENLTDAMGLADLMKTLANQDGNDTQDTSPTFKVLEEGATVLSREEVGKLAQRQAQFIQHLQAALVRIENKTYGICRQTGKLISKERLRAVPHATLSIEAKNLQK